MFMRFLAWAMGGLTGMPKNATSHVDAITAHADAALGQAAQHWHEHYSPDIHVDILHYSPMPDRDFHYLLTSGMSDLPMTNEGEGIAEPLMEVMLALPAQWDMSERGFQDPATFLPVQLLKLLARYPHGNGTFFEKYHTVNLGDDPLFGPMKAAMLMPPVLVPEFREPLLLPSGERIQFMAIYLLHQDELELKLSGDLERLFERFGETEMSEMFNLSRPSSLA